MALTIRTTAEDDSNIACAGRMLNEKSASKTLLKCAELVPIYRDKIRDLERENDDLKREIFKIKDAYREKVIADSVLATLLQDD